MRILVCSKIHGYSSCNIAEKHEQGEEFETSIDFDVSAGCTVYDERDEKNIPQVISRC